MKATRARACTTQYAVALRRTGEGYSVNVPGLPGCWSQGRTKAEALTNIREAILEYLSVAQRLARRSECHRVRVAI